MSSYRLLSAITILSLVVNALPVSAAPLKGATATPPQAPSVNPANVTIAGDLQSELGCAGDWDPACATTHLTYDATDDVWQGTFSVPTGSYNYKAALNDGWTESYGANGGGDNIPLTVGSTTSVKFYYDHNTHWVADNRGG